MSSTISNTPVVLASLLPGLREIRAPLAAGYVWMVGAWLVTAPHLPAHPPASGVYADVYRLAHYVGTPAIIAAISLIAYVAGILSIAAFNTANAASTMVPWPGLIRSVLPGHRSWSQVYGEATDTVIATIAKRFRGDEEFRNVLLMHIRDIQERALRDDRRLVSPLSSGSAEVIIQNATTSVFDLRTLLFSTVDISRIVNDLEEDLRFVPARLVGTDAADLYAEYGRLDAESDFRYGLSLPLIFISIVLSVRLHPAWLLGLLVSIVLGYLGAQARTESKAYLLAAISSGRIINPVIDRLASDNTAFRHYEDLIEDDAEESERQ